MYNPRQKFNFEILKQGPQAARLGVLQTPHGIIKTPAFIVASTNASVKTLNPDQVLNLGGQSVLVNAYHLMLRPGEEIVSIAGGVHKFMNWQKPIFASCSEKV